MMNWKEMAEEEVVACFKVISQNFLGRTEENPSVKKISSLWALFKSVTSLI
jgi:hypothetical protein